MNARLPTRPRVREASSLNQSQSDRLWLSAGASASSVARLAKSRTVDMLAPKKVNQTA